MSNPLAEMGLPVAGQAPPPAVLQGNPLAEMGLPVLESAAMQPARAPVGAMESIEAGWQASGPGLYWRKRLPDLVLDPSLNKWWERALTGITQVGSELPLMIPSAIVGSIAGGVAGAAVTWPAAPAGAAVGGLLGAGAAMFAIPGGIRESLMQAYKPGGVQTAEEWWQAVRSVAATIAKEAGIGAATFGAGGVARGAAAAAIGASREAATAIGMGTAQAIGATAKVAGTADLAAQIVAMTSLPAALQGRIPDWQEFMDAAIVVGGLKTAHVVANRMMNVYRTTGKTPIEQVADANAKPGIKEELTKPEPPPADVLASGAPRFPDPIRVQEQMFAELAMKDAIRAGKPVEGEVPSPDLPAAQLLMSAKAESGRTEQPWTEKLVEKLANPEDPDRPAIFRMLFPEIAKAEEQPTTAREAAIWREARGEQGAAGKIEFPELGPRLEKFEQPLSEAQQKKVDQLEARITQLRKMVDSEALLKKDLDGLRERFTREIRNLDEPRIRNALEEFGPNYPETIAEIMVRSVEQRVRRLGKTVEEIYGGKFVSLRSGFWMLDPRLEIDANRKALEAEAQAIIVATPALKESTASLWTAIRELGGINIQHRSDIEKQTGKKAPPNVFTENGLPLDVLTVDLKARQWDVKTEDVDGGVQSLRDMIAAEIVEAGTALRMGDESIVAARDARDRARGAAEAIGKALGNKKMTPDEETVVRDFLDQIDSRKTEETKQAETIEMAERANRVSRETIERDGVKEWVDVAREGGLSDGDIAAVVTAAPGDPQLQGIGLSYAMNGTEYGSALASNLVRALKLLGVSKDKPEYTDAQMTEAMMLAKAAGLRQTRVAELIEIATERFEDGRGDAKDIVDLRQTQSRWQTWEADETTVTELRAEMKRAEGGELAQGPREVPDIIKTAPGTYVVGLNGKEIARANLAQKEDGSFDNYFVSVRVDPEFRRTGIASRLYDFVEADTGQSLRPSPSFQTPDAKAFWEERQSRLDQTQTAEFKRWFGDSKVVDAKGKPLVVYHGTTSDFSAFDAAKAGGNSRHPTARLGFWFSESPAVADLFNEAWDASTWPPTRTQMMGANTMPLYLSIKNPYVMTVEKFREINGRPYGEDFEREQPEAAAKTKDWIEKNKASLLSKGYDGIKVEGDAEYAERMGGEEYSAAAWVAFRPEQIKSAIGNRGTFDPTDPNILYQSPREFFSLTPETPGELAARNKLAVEMARREVMEKRAEYRAQVEAEKARGQQYLERQSTLFQEKRAAYDKASKVVTLFKTADRSSLIHEVMGHDWLEELRQDAGRPDAPAQIKADWRTAVEWLNTMDRGMGELSVDLNAMVGIPDWAHEHWAKASERYFMEGNAPAIALRPIFERIKNWMVEIYKTLTGLNAEINPEIRAIFDRKIASDREIELARELGVPREYVPVAADAKMAEMVQPADEPLKPGFIEEQISVQPFSDAELMAGPGSGRTNDSRVNPDTMTSSRDIRLALQRMSEIGQEAIQKRRGGKGGVMGADETKVIAEGVMKNVYGGDVMRFLRELSAETRIPLNIVMENANNLMIWTVDNSLRLRDQVLQQGYDTPVDLGLRYLQSILLSRMVHQEFLGLRAEAARTMHDLQRARGLSEEMSQFLDQAMAERGGEARPLFQSAPTRPEKSQEQIKAELDAIMLKYFKGKSPFDVAKMQREVNKTLKANLGFNKAVVEATTWEKFMELWKSWGLLSGPVTPVTNVVSTQGFQLLQTPIDAVAALIGMSRGSKVGFGESDRASMSEAAAGLWSYLGGTIDGLKAAYGRLKVDESEVGKVESFRQAIGDVQIGGRTLPTGHFARFWYNVMAAGDSFTRTMYEQKALRQLAMRQAFDEQGNPQTVDFAARVREIMDNADKIIPKGETKSIQQLATELGIHYQFNDPLLDKGRALQLWVSKWHLEWMVPFIRTPINIAKETARLSPLAPLVGEWRAEFRRGGAHQDRALAELAVGTSLMVLMGAYALSGDITGSGDPDPGKTRGKSGRWQMGSVKIGENYYEMARLQPTGTLMVAAADMVSFWQYMTDDEKDKIPRLLARSFANAVTNQTFLQGITNVVNAMSDPARFGPRFLQSLAGTLVPNIVGQTTRIADPYVREVNSAFDAIKARLPGFSQELEPRFDWLGQKLETRERLGMVLPMRIQPISRDKVRKEAEEMGLSVGVAPKKLHIGKGTREFGWVDITPEERTKWAQVSGEMAHKLLSDIVVTQGYDQLPPTVKKRIFKRILAASHRVGAIQALPMDKRIAYLQDIAENITEAMQPQ